MSGLYSSLVVAAVEKGVKKLDVQIAPPRSFHLSLAWPERKPGDAGGPDPTSHLQDALGCEENVDAKDPHLAVSHLTVDYVEIDRTSSMQRKTPFPLVGARDWAGIVQGSLPSDWKLQEVLGSP